jgi:hypothetical protein
MIVPDEDDDVDDAVVQTYYQVLINCLFHMFLNVPQVWNKVFRLQVIDLHGFLFIIIIIVPLF